ncbi:hypothetical protein [uncultured Hoeflea sp.]|uniref:hypothetical protein n=1 Tax=uncultured Hoeflea sp. TaxID=538666 RepID=UPI00262811CA|nr:hypothetical protein [uncultured Hoeflea sp.]
MARLKQSAGRGIGAPWLPFRRDAGAKGALLPEQSRCCADLENGQSRDGDGVDLFYPSLTVDPFEKKENDDLRVSEDQTPKGGN